jgi:glycogen operon protein
MRNLLATLLLSQGVPMISGGDEIARSQGGNNNAYCQDDEISWYDWNLDEPRKRLLDFTSRLIHFRKDHPNLHRRKFFQDRQVRNSSERDIAWYGTNGKELGADCWEQGWQKSVAMLLNGTTLAVSDVEGNPVVDDTFLILFNAFHEGVEFALPGAPSGGGWQRVLNTEDLDNPFSEEQMQGSVIVGGRSVVLLREAGPAWKKPRAKKAEKQTVAEAVNPAAGAVA